MSNRALKKLSSRGRIGISEQLESRLLMSTYTVDDNGPADFHSIQLAVAAAAPGDTIKVLPGTYHENVTIPAGKDNLKIRSEKRWGAIVQPVVADGAVFEDDGSAGIEIRGFKIVGAATANGTDYGVLVNSGSAQITENWITGIRDNPRSGVQSGVGVGVLSGSADIQKNLIDDYQKGGIVIDGAASSASISQNVVTGAGLTPLLAQNGIQISAGATAVVKQNVVSNNLYQSPDPNNPVAAVGIYLLSAGAGSSVSQNDVFRNDENIVLEATNGAVVQQNDVSRATYEGIALFGSSTNRISQNDVEKSVNGPGIGLFDGSNNNTVEQNTSNQNGLDGISVYGSDNNTIRQNKANDNTYDGIFLNTDTAGNHISQNSMFGNGSYDAEDLSHGPGTAGTANFWDRNKGETSNPPGLLENGGHGHGHGHDHDHEHDHGHGHGHGHSPWED